MSHTLSIITDKMSVFETPRTTSAHDEALKIRLELKEWERLFAATHDGRKASRGDIKQHPDIGIPFSYTIHTTET